MIEIYLLNEDNTLKHNVLYNETTNQYYNENFEWIELDCSYTTIKPPYAKIVSWNGTSWDIVEEYPTDTTQTPTEIQKLRADVDYIALEMGVDL